MVQWTKMVFRTIKVFLLFTGCTILFYYALIWFNEEYQDLHRYDEPSGAAVKVNSAVSKEDSSWKDRILLFYLNGE
ncbi:YqzK family protein [Niallia sp. 03133]|uniref:YqzK family protein n=1 Tax=Niallia sp. 03133 TaxID=3458060 RepID=UPI0040441BB9